MEVGQLALDLIINLLADVIYTGVDTKALPYFQRRKIERRIEDATAEVVEPLLPFLAQEKIPEDKQHRLIETCVDELRPFTKKPEPLFRGALNGQKIFDELYAGRQLPQTVTEDGLQNVYALLFPRIATLLCQIPAAVKDWESQAWAENYRRLDEIVSQLRGVYAAVDDLRSSPSRGADELLATVRRALAQKTLLELDLTGLRADRPLVGKFDDFFVHPEIKEIVKDGRRSPGTARNAIETFVQFAARGRRIVIIGAPGAGKSTWTKWLQRETLTQRWTGIAIRVELRRLSPESLVSLQTLIRDAAGQHLAEELTSERIRRWLDQAQVLFILDGFDEIRPGERDKVHDWVEELSAAARRCPFILTSRPLTTNHLERLEEEWPQWSMEPFDNPRIVDYIGRWYSHTPLLLDGGHDVDAAALAKSWLEDPAIGPLTGNPLLLSTLLTVHHLDGRLPSGRAQLYKRYVEGMLGLWDDRRKVNATDISLAQVQKHQIMRGLALRMFLEGQEQLDEPMVEEWLQSTLSAMNLRLAANDVLTALRERTGLLIGPGIYGFVHKTVAEYLVAESILQGDQRDAKGQKIDRLCLLEHRQDDRWNTVTFLWAGLAPVTDLESFIDACLAAGESPLAFGLLHDQSERIPRDTQRRWFTGIDIGRPATIEDHIGYVTSGPQRRFRIRVPDYKLRSASQGARWSDLIRQAIDNATLTSLDYGTMAPPMSAVTWLSLSTSPLTPDALRTVLQNVPAEVNLSYGLQCLLITWGIGRALRKPDKPDIGPFLDVYREVWPESIAYLPLALMSLPLEIIHMLEAGYSRENLVVDRLASLLRALASSDMSKIPPSWLAGTEVWVSELPTRLNSFDLLAEFVALIEKLAEQGTLARDETFQRAISCVENLRQRREALDPIILAELKSQPLHKEVSLLKSEADNEGQG